MSAKRTSTKRDLAARLLLLAYSLTSAGLISSCGSTSVPAPDKREMAVLKLDAVVGKANEASRFGGPWRDANDDVPDSVLQRMKDYNEVILKDSNDIDCDALNSAYPNLGTMFRDKFIKGIALSVEFGQTWIDLRRSGGHLVMTPELQQKANESKLLDMEWAEWFNGHFNDINKALSGFSSTQH
jgi:hypothetical protein